MLRPYFEAYEIVADVLRDSPAEIDEKELTKQALGVGNQYVAQDRVRSTEAVSALLFTTARQVVADQHLLEPAADLVERRTAFRDELRGILRDMDKVEQISREQFVAREIGAARPARMRPSSSRCPRETLDASATSRSRRWSKARSWVPLEFLGQVLPGSRRSLTIEALHWLQPDYVRDGADPHRYLLLPDRDSVAQGRRRHRRSATPNRACETCFEHARHRLPRRTFARSGIPTTSTRVVNTHLHVDHVGWNTHLMDGDDGCRPSRNATYYFVEQEYLPLEAVRRQQRSGATRSSTPPRFSPTRCGRSSTPDLATLRRTGGARSRPRSL